MLQLNFVLVSPQISGDIPVYLLHVHFIHCCCRWYVSLRQEQKNDVLQTCQNKVRINVISELALAEIAPVYMRVLNKLFPLDRMQGDIVIVAIFFCFD